MIHKSEVENYNGSMVDLVEEIENLKYDSLSKFLNLLSTKIKNDGIKDESRGRNKLCSNLYQCSEKLEQSADFIDRAWEICKPYTK